MKHTDRVGAKTKLEDLCAQWASLGPEDAAVKQNIQGEIFELVFDLFPGREDEITTVFLNDWIKYDPVKGPAYGFFSSRIGFKKKDTYRDEKIHRDRTVAGEVQTDDGEDANLLENLPAGPDANPEDALKLDATACELLTLMLELPQRLQGRANNPTRHKYFRMFFTDGIATYLHQTPSAEVFQKRQRDLFAAMKLDFLDFFMRESCRTIPAVCCCPLKPYGELVKGRDMAETRLPLPGDVYVSYLDRVEHTKAGPSAVSQQRTAYEAEVKKWLF